MTRRPSRYAERTEVPPERSRDEIEHTLRRYGASAFGYGWQEDRAVVTFKAQGRFVQIAVRMPTEDDVVLKSDGTRIGKQQIPGAIEKAQRQRWRALALCIKAKLEAVEAGIATFEEEFLAHIMLPDGKTVGSMLAPQIEEAYSSGAMPKGLTLALPAGDD